MKKLFIIIFLALVSCSAMASVSEGGSASDTSEVIKLNKQGFAMRMTNPEQTVAYGQKAMEAAQKINYKAGIGESYRIMGIGNYYLNESKKAIDDYLTALDYFQQIHDLSGQGRVYNNIGSLYRDNDYDLALTYFNQALRIAQKLSDTKLIAPLVARIYLNIGDVYFRKNSFYQALNYDNKSKELFAALKDSVNLVLCLQNTGVVYFYLHEFDKADSLLLAANKEATQLDLNEAVASIDLTLASSYFDQKRFAESEKVIQQGLVFAAMIKDEKLVKDFKYTDYQLEIKRKNYKSAVTYLYDIYHKDSTAFKGNSSNQITLIREQYKQQAKQKDYEFLLQRQAYDRVKFWAVAIVAGLLLFLVGVLISNVKRKAKTNLQLTNLNAEVSRQKDNLDRINHHLEEIIDERTRDLQLKNKKLSEYSSYLSHQIRGPIATLKGLLNLEKEGLVNQKECIRMMNKSVSDIDDRIIDMSDMLHDPGRTGF
jgi:tetratricopeptide (TPR) repeat protein